MAWKNDSIVEVKRVLLSEEFKKYFIDLSLKTMKNGSNDVSMDWVFPNFSELIQ